VALADAAPGPVVVGRISEKMELDDEALQMLVTARLVPECEAIVVTRDLSGVTVKTDTGEHVVPISVASLMYVRPG
jgi:hypothetical protein